MSESNFKSVLSDVHWSDKLYKFLQVVFHLYPEDKFHQLIKTETESKQNDEEIYKSIKINLKKIKPFLSELTYALPSLKKQKKEMSDQVLRILGGRNKYSGYLEVGSTGRYISELRKHLEINGDIYITNDIAPDNSIADILERGRLRKIGTFFDLNNYEEISKERIPDNSIDLITCHIGLHHCPLDLLEKYILSIKRILRNNGLFIMRDHDVKDQQMDTFASFIHTIFNLGLQVDWEVNKKEFKSFRSIEEWCKLISSFGLQDMGERILQKNDPSKNTLVAFKKTEA